ncbi:EF-hand domain-containing protein [Asticcacaulis taihuensis]|uniref:EF-hand domain-containing protein n=1 Tax=Asticcacaulis taihuensis TaxID=260084 RepID=UPI0026F33706|nr:EF-hand domain-containing protein [Asticcacaulis taihuensis]
MAAQADEATQVARAIAHKTIQMQDRNHDGRISLKESAGAALNMFGSIDADQSQTISSTEMLTVAMNDVAALKISNSPDQTAALVQARFQVMDIDGDGSVSLPEMLAVTETVFDAADANADGFVSEDELTDLALQRGSTEEAR